MFTSMGINVVDADTLPSKPKQDVRISNKGENTQQKKPKATNRQVFSKQQSVPRARKRTTKKSS